MSGCLYSSKKWKEINVNDKASHNSVTHWKKLFCLGIFVFAASVLMSQPVYAGAAGLCPLPTGESEGIELFSSLVPCLIDHIQNHGRVLIEHMQTVTKPIFQAFLVLTVLIYGILLITGMLQKAGRDTFVFLIKIMVVIWVTENLVYVHDSMYVMMDALVKAVTITGNAGGGVRCQVAATVWGQLDCIVDMVIGLGTRSTQMLTNGLLGFFLSAFLSGSMGTLIGLLGLYFCVNLVIGSVKAAYIYILAVLSLVLLIMMGSLLVPLIFFKTTFGYFSSWSTMVLSAVLQPMLLFAFLSVVVEAMDVIIYSGDNSIYYTIAGEASRAPDFNLALYLADNGIYQEDSINYATSDANKETFEQCMSAAQERGDQGATQDLTLLCDGISEATATRSDPNNWANGIPIPRLSFDVLTAVSNGGTASSPTAGDATAVGAKLLALATSFIIACLTGFMFVTMLDHVPKIARDLSGGAYNTPALNETGFENASQQLMSQVGAQTASMASRVGSLVGGR